MCVLLYAAHVSARKRDIQSEVEKHVYYQSLPHARLACD